MGGPRWLIVLSIFFYIFVFVQGSSYKETRTFRQLYKRYRRLLNECDVYDGGTSSLTKLSDLQYGQPDGYLARLSFYTVGLKNVSIYFSSKENLVDLREDDTFYNITITSDSVEIKQSADVFTHVNVENLLIPDAPLKLLIEITLDGIIRMYIEISTKLLAMATDTREKRSPVSYYGFWSEQLQGEIFYNCPGEQPPSIGDLEKSCKFQELSNTRKVGFKPTTNDLSSKYRLDMVVYIKPEENQPIYLSIHDGYSPLEMAFGDGTNRTFEVVAVGDHARGLVAYDKFKINQLEKFLLTFLFRQSIDGQMKVFVQDDFSTFWQMAVSYPGLDLHIEHILFESTGRSKLFYDCSSVPTPPLDDYQKSYPKDPLLAEISSGWTHPLLKDSFSSTDNRKNILKLKCIQYNTKQVGDNNKFIEISKLRNGSKDNYTVQLPIYIQGYIISSIQIVLSPEHDEKYGIYSLFVSRGFSPEFKIAKVFKNKLTVLAEAMASEDFNFRDKPMKIVIEVTKSGHFRVYSETNKTHPMIEAFDYRVFPINYLSFNVDKITDIFYNCPF